MMNNELIAPGDSSFVHHLLHHRSSLPAITFFRSSFVVHHSPVSPGGGERPIVARMSERFYINCPLAAGRAVLEGEEAHHLAAVCRLRPGDPLFLFNGDGLEYPARVQQMERGRVVLEVLPATRPVRELGYSLLVACPLPKGDRAQFLLEKLTELGVTSVVPLHSQRRTLHPRELRPDRLGRYVIEASKQCGRNVLLQVDAAASWESFCRRGDLPALKVLAHPESPRSVADLLPDLGMVTGVAVAVGPEGGFSSAEAELAQSAGWVLVNLGPRMLRVETAAIFLATAIVLGKAGGASPSPISCSTV